MSLTTFKQFAMLEMYQTGSKVNDFSLRDLVYILQILEFLISGLVNIDLNVVAFDLINALNFYF